MTLHSSNAALLLSGQARNFKKTYSGFKKYILDPLGCDVFINVSRDNDFKENEFTTFLDDVDFNYNACLITRDFELPRKHAWMKEFEPYEKRACKVKNPLRKMYHRNMLQIYYLERCWGLMDSWDKKYDVVIRSRMDMLIKTPIPDIDTDKMRVYTSQFGATHPGCCNDRFAVGGYEPMKVYCNRWTGFEGLEWDGEPDKNTIAECQLANYLDIHNVDYKKMEDMYAKRWYMENHKTVDRETP